MKVPLHVIADLASSVGLPSHKTSLIRALDKAGARCEAGRVKGGQIGKLYNVDTLPERLRLKLSEQRGEDTPSAAKVAFSFYSSAPPTLKKEAERRLILVLAVSRYRDRGAALPVAICHVAEEMSVSARTLRRYLARLEGLESTDWLPALVPFHKGRSQEDVDPRVVRCFFRDFGRVEQPKAQACYERTLKAAGANGWGTVPSLKTLQRRFNALPAAEKVLMREGEEALKAFFPHQERDRSGMLPLDGLNMDSRVWDVMVQLADGRKLRPIVTMIQDEASNAILAWEITEAESGQSYRRVICKSFECYGLADQIRFDNTMAAANKAITAGAKGRFRFTNRPDDVPGLLPRLGVVVRFTQVRNGRAKLVERAFAELKERSEKDPRLAGAYTGPSPSEKPSNYGDCAAPIALFTQILTETVEHYNHRTDRRSKVAFRKSYMAVFEAGRKSRQVRILTEDQRRLFFFSAKRVVPTVSGEVFIGTQPHRHRYHDVAIENFAHRHPGQPIVVRYDENDLSAPIVAETIEGREIAGIVTRIEPGLFNSVEDAKLYARKRRERIKATKLAARNLTEMEAMRDGEIGAMVAGSSASSLPSPIVQLTPSKRPRPKVETVFPERDRAKLAAAQAALEGRSAPEPELSELENERRFRRGEENLVRLRAG